jgi:hypothetical protein
MDAERERDPPALDGRRLLVERCRAHRWFCLALAGEVAVDLSSSRSLLSFASCIAARLGASAAELACGPPG